MTAAVESCRDRLIHIRLCRCTQQLAADQQKQIALAQGQSLDIRFFNLHRGNDGVVVGYVLVGDHGLHQRIEMKIKLATYASRCIENEVLMFLRRHSRTRMEVSLDEPLKTDWDGNELLLSDGLGTDPDMVSRGIEESAERQMLFAALSHLSPREQQIMDLRFGLHGHPEMTQKEVADILGISQSYISRLEKRILHRLHGELVREEGYA